MFERFTGARVQIIACASHATHIFQMLDLTLVCPNGAVNTGSPNGLPSVNTYIGMMQLFLYSVNYNSRYCGLKKSEKVATSQDSPCIFILSFDFHYLHFWS
jgi:hypothetical protein